jgi:hypothetical protein
LKQDTEKQGIGIRESGIEKPVGEAGCGFSLRCFRDSCNQPDISEPEYPSNSKAAISRRLSPNIAISRLQK